MMANQINKRLTKVQRQNIEIPEHVGQALVGLLLGDGFLSLLTTTSNARFGFAQSGKDAKREYFTHVFDLFSMFCTPGLRPYIKTFTRTGFDSVYTSISFVTMRLPCFNKYHNLYYSLESKIVPYNIMELLTPVGLAYWIMDDGSKQNNGLHLNVYAFDSESVNRLMEVLNLKFDLKCIVHKHKSHGMTSRIYIPESSMNNLRTLVMPYILPSIMYKLSVLNYI